MVWKSGMDMRNDLTTQELSFPIYWAKFTDPVSPRLKPPLVMQSPPARTNNIDLNRIEHLIEHLK
jgi:hypothetical protein